jgi:hypothetical protein
VAVKADDSGVTNRPDLGRCLNWQATCPLSCMNEPQKVQDSRPRVSMQRLDPFAHERVPVAISQRSADDLVFDSPVPLFPGALVQLRDDRTFLLGNARTCREKGTGFEVVLSVDRSYRSAVALVEPG